jgi:SCF-associated factor 1
MSMCISATHRSPSDVTRPSCGRLHSMALDSKNQVWTFINWGRPFRLDTTMLDCTSPETTPIQAQAESGWSFCSILTQSGDVLVFWPFIGEIGRHFHEENIAMDERGDCQAYPTSDHRIPCIAWPLRADPSRIPPIPELPELSHTGSSQEERSKTTLIKIAAFDNHLIGLTNKGHILKFGDLSNDTSFDRRTRWQYVRSSCITIMFKLTYGKVGEFQRTFQSRSASRFRGRELRFDGPNLSADHACTS